MAFKVNLEDLEMKPHPKFKGVDIGFVVTKEKHPELSITILRITKDTEIPLHTHEREVDSIFILEGEGEIYLNENWQKVKKGDVVVVGAGEVHGLRANETIKCYIVHAPALW